MYLFFFDLDDTLLNTSQLTFLDYIRHFYHNLDNPNFQVKNYCINAITSSYNQNISYDYQLRSLLIQLNYPKYIITNASRIHSILSLRNLGILDLFKGGIDANSIPRSKLKPHSLPYIEALKISKLDNKKYNCVFFDNLAENHVEPKKMGWITVFIGPEYTNKYGKPHYIDYCFNNIYDALKFFINNLNK